MTQGNHNRNATLGELSPGTIYVTVVCDGPYTRGVDDPPELPETAEVFPLERVAPSRRPGKHQWRAGQ